MARLFLSISCLLVLAASTQAARVPSSKADRTNNFGARPDITVPYLTNGTTTLGVAPGVSPIISPSPGLGGEKGDTERPVFNLIFYGSWKSSSPDFIFATKRPANSLRPYR